MDELRKLFEKLRERKLYTNSWEDFQKKYGTEEDAKKLHSALSERLLYTNGESAFLDKYYSHLKKKDITESPLEDGGLEQFDSEAIQEQPTTEAIQEQPTTDTIQKLKPEELPQLVAESQQRVIGEDIRTTGYQHLDVGMYPDEQEVQKAFAQVGKDFETTRKTIEKDAPLLAQIQKGERQEAKVDAKKYQKKEIQSRLTKASQQAAKAKTLRSAARDNEDGTYSSVKFQSGIIDGKNVVYPTLFPNAEKGEKYGSDPLWWKELDGMDAFKEAQKRGEVFEFETQEEAEKFAKGSWKNLSSLDAEATLFYGERGMDYSDYKPKIDRFKKVRDEIDFIERAPFELKELSDAEQEKYARFYINGRRRADIHNISKSLQQENEQLYDEVNSPEQMQVREDFDLYLDKKYQEKIAEAVTENRYAIEFADYLQSESLRKFGVKIEDLNTIEPSDENQRKEIQEIIDIYNSNVEARKDAATKYELANTYLDSKYDENVRDEFLENWDGVKNEWNKGWANGKAGNAILALALGIEDVNDDTTVEELSEKIVQYMDEAKTGKSSRVLSRWNQARGFVEAWDVFANDPAELSASFAANSISQMLPYGWKILSSSVGTGVTAGAVAGLAGGPYAPATSTAGALTGLAYGARAGFAATSMALEYTNAVLDAARNRGINLDNPEEVKEALQTKEVWDEGREIGLKRGIPIAVVDMLGGKLAGRVFNVSKVASRTKRLGAGISERAVFDPAMEGLGETAAMITAGQELEVKDIMAEMIGGVGMQTPNALINMYRDSKSNSNIDIADKLSTASGIANETASDERISQWANNMEKIGKITPEQNQRIQKNIGLRRDVRDVLGTEGGIFRPTKKTDVEARLIELMNARDELSSTPNRKNVFKSKIALINEEISELADGNELRPVEEQVSLEGLGIVTMGMKADRGTKPKTTKEVLTEEDRKDEEFYKSRLDFYLSQLDDNDTPLWSQEQAERKALSDFDAYVTVRLEEQRAEAKLVEEAGYKEMTEEEYYERFYDSTEDTQESFMRFAAEELGNEQNTYTEQEQKERAIEIYSRALGEYRAEAKEKAIAELERRATGEVATGEVTTEESVLEDTQEELSPEEQEALEQEAKDFGEYLDNPNDPKFQLEEKEQDKRRQKSLVKSATNLMNQLHTELAENTDVVQELTDDTQVIEVKENTALADKVRKMGYKELIGKRINLVMADQLKVDETRMGGHFFPLIDKLFGKIAWASIDRKSAMDIARGAIDADYSVVYNMSPSAIDSNLVTLDSLLTKIRESKNPDALFNAMKSYMLTVKFGESGKKTGLVHNIVNESRTLDDFAERFAQLDVDTKADIFKKVLPSEKVDAGTEVGQMFQEEGVSQESIRRENIEQFAADLPMGSMTMVLKITDKQGNPITKETLEEAVVSPEEQDAEGLPQHRNYPYYLRGKAVAMLKETTPFWNVLNKYRDAIDLKIQGIIKQKEKYTVAVQQGKKTVKRIVKVRNNPDGTRTVELIKKGETSKVEEEFVIPKSTKTSTKTFLKKKYGDVIEVENVDKTITSKKAKSEAMRSASMSASTARVVTEPTAMAYERFVKRLSKAFPNVEVVTSQEAFDTLAADANAKGLSTKNQKIYGAVYEGRLYLNPSLENFNTPIHEFGHIWSNVAKELNPEMYKRGIELIREDNTYIAQVEANPEYQRIIKKMRQKKSPYTEADVQAFIEEEALATAIGDKGESFAIAAQKVFKNWLTELFEFVKKLTGISKMSSEQIQNLNLDEFLQGVVVDLMSQNELFKDAEVKSFGTQLQLMTAPSASAQTIVSSGREAGFSDAAIREVLKSRGFSKTDINNALEVPIDLLTTMPKEFERVIGGMQKALQLFTDVREQLNRYSTEGPRGGRGTTQTKTIGQIRAKAMELMRSHPIFNEQNDQIQLELLSSFDRTLGTRANKAVQKEISAIRTALRQRRVGQMNLRDAQIKLKNLIRKSLPKSKLYSQGQINRLISLISKTNLDNFEAQSETVLEIVDQQRNRIKRAVINQMTDLITKKAKAAYTRSGKRRSKGLDAEGQSFFNALKPIIKAVKKNDVDALEKLRKEIEANELEINEISLKITRGEQITHKERTLHNKALALDTYGDINNLSLEEVQELFEKVKEERAESILRLKSRRLMRAEMANYVAEQTTNQIKETNPELFDEDGNVLNRNELDAVRDSIHNLWRKKKYPEAIKEWVKNFNYSYLKDILADAKNMFRHLGTLTNLVDRVTNDKNAFANNVYRKLNRMNEVEHIGRFETNKRIDDIAKSLGVEKGYKGIKRLLQGDLMELRLKRSDTGNMYDDVFSRDQLLRIYALSLNDTQRAKLNKQNITDDVLESIKTELGPTLVSFAEEVVNFLSNDYFEQVNSIYASVNDINLGYIENYFPTQTVQSKVGGKLLEEGDFNGIFNAEIAPALKERVDRLGDVILKQGNFTEVLDNHFDTMEKFKAYAQGTKEINMFFQIPAVDVLLTELYIKNAMKQAVNFAINPNAGGKNVLSNKIIEKIQRLYTGFALSFKAVQIPKQATSFINAYSEYSYFPKDSNVPRIVKSTVDFPMFMFDGARVIVSMAGELVGRKGALAEAIEMSATFRSRIEKGLEGDQYGLESGSKTFVPLSKSESRLGRAKRGFKTAGSIPTIIGDVLGVMGYMINYKRNIANGMNPQDAVEAFNNYNPTQQSRRGTEKIPLQMSTNVLTRSFTMFGSTVFLQINKVMSSSTNIMRSIREGKTPRKQDIRDFYLNAALANSLFVGVSHLAMFIKGDDEDREAAMRKMAEAMLGMNLLYQLPFIGSAAEKADVGGRIIAGIKREDYKYKRTFGDPVVNPITSIYYKTKKTINKDGWVVGSVRPITELVIGTQLDPFIGLYNMFKDTEWNDDNMYDVVGISPSYRPKEDEGTPPKKKSMTKADMKKYMPKMYEEIYKDTDEYMKEIRKEKNAILKEIKDEAYGDLKNIYNE